MPKLIAERQAGKYVVDVHVGGPTSPIRALLPIGALDPVESFLVLPAVKDPANWFQNQLWFMDHTAKYILCFAASAAHGTRITYNTQQVQPGEVTSWHELLQPRWRGKIASADPSIGGTMRGNLSSIAAVPELGLDYLRKLYAPEHGVRLTADNRVLQDWVAQGQYPIGLGISTLDAEQAGRLGLPVATKALKESLPELTAQWHNLTVVNQAPHPNATRVYVNWLLGKEGQLAYQKAVETASLRVDVPREGVKLDEVPDPSVRYELSQHEKYTALRDEVQNLVKELTANR
jgi:iron(III) transport system substrate-binding protein